MEPGAVAHERHACEIKRRRHFASHCGREKDRHRSIRYCFKTGLKISASGWQQKGFLLDLDLFLTISLEGQSEELVFDVVANERAATLRQLDWPAHSMQVISTTHFCRMVEGLYSREHGQKSITRFRTITPEGKIAASDHSLLQSHVVESWSMSWWGFQRVDQE
jgi:hypothetical protein